MSLRHERVEFRGTRCVRLRRDGARALVALHGAQVLSWIGADGRERLFLAERADFGAGGAIRGGIPVIFPQFSERGGLRRHGFARTAAWDFAGVADGAAVFRLADGPHSAPWPHRFDCRLSVALDATRLTLSLEVRNTGVSAFGFTAALHTYLAVDDLAATTLEGLQGCDYEDTANGGTLHREHRHALTFDGEVDRIYGDVVAPLSLRDGTGELAAAQDGFGDTVVWNPGDALAARIGDLAPGEHRRFVCVEAAQVLQPVLLAPGDAWRGWQRFG